MNGRRCNGIALAVDGFGLYDFWSDTPDFLLWTLVSTFDDFSPVPVLSSGKFHTICFFFSYRLTSSVSSKERIASDWSSSFMINWALIKVFLNMISSLILGLLSRVIGIDSQASDGLGVPFLILLYCHVDNCCKKDALISKFGRLELMNSKDFRSDQLNFIIK